LGPLGPPARQRSEADCAGSVEVGTGVDAGWDFFELIAVGFLALRGLLLEIFGADGFFVILFVVALGILMGAGGVVALEEVEV